MNPIASLKPVLPVEPLTAAGTSPAASVDFGSVLRSAIDNVESSGAVAKGKVNEFLSGESTDLHSVAIAGQKASLDFDLFLQIRNKVVQAYQEVMRLQL